MPKLAYPDAIKKAGWEKQKGIIIKLAKKDPGLSPACDKAEAAYNKINWENLNGKNAFTCKNTEQYKAFMTKLKTERNTSVIPARDALMALGALAKKSVAELAASPVIPKEVRAYAEKIATEANRFSVQVEQAADKDIAEGAAAEAKLAAMQALQAQVAAGGITKVLADGKLKTAFATFVAGKPVANAYEAYVALVGGHPKGPKASQFYNTHLKSGASKYAPIASGTLASFTAAGATFASAQHGLDGMDWGPSNKEILKMTNENIAGSSGRNTFISGLTKKFGPKAPDIIKQFSKCTNYPSLKANATLMKLYREVEPGKFITENFDFIDKTTSGPKGATAITIYETYVKQGSAQEVNIPASMRVPFDTAYDNFKKSGTLFDNLPWGSVQTDLKSSLDGFVTRAFAVELWKFV